MNLSSCDIDSLSFASEPQLSYDYPAQ